MFRFTIRELVLVTIVVALGVGWVLERWRNRRLEKSLTLAENEARVMEAAVESLHEDIERIEQGLPSHGLTLHWSRDMRPSLQKLKQAP